MFYISWEESPTNIYMELIAIPYAPKKMAKILVENYSSIEKLTALSNGASKHGNIVKLGPSIEETRYLKSKVLACRDFTSTDNYYDYVHCSNNQVLHFINNKWVYYNGQKWFDVQEYFFTDNIKLHDLELLQFHIGAYGAELFLHTEDNKWRCKIRYTNSKSMKATIDLSKFMLITYDGPLVVEVPLYLTGLSDLVALVKGLCNKEQRTTIDFDNF